jgi:hypothetical protein
MISIADGSLHIQTASEAQFATPSWLGEVALVASHLQKQGILNKICERVRFARRRFGRYDVLDFLAVLFGYAISGERTLEAFYESVQPFAVPFMALFGRASLPAASTLSRFLAALPAEPVEALRTLFLEDLLARRLGTEESCTGLWDRQENRWLVFDIDGTREAARQRALPQTPDRPVPQRRLRPLCAPGYAGRKRGEVVRTRTTILQMHTRKSDCKLWQSWQRTLSRGTALGEGCYPGVYSGSPRCPRAYAASPGRSIWHRSSRLRSR